MIIINNILNTDGLRATLNLPSVENLIIDGTNLLLLPGLIDCHVHFRTPGMEHKENWLSGAEAAFRGGITTVFDMPNTIPSTINYQRLIDKITLVNQQIKSSGFPLRYQLFFGADKHNFEQIIKVKDLIVGIKVFMSNSTGDLVINDLSSLHAIYALAKVHGLLIALHAEDQMIIAANLKQYCNESDFKYHSLIRPKEAAIKAVGIAIELSQLYFVPSYLLHLSSREEIELVAEAKAKGIAIYAETCPHYLFMNQEMQSELKGRAKMNPPLRTKADQDYLWQAISNGVIDTIASDHAPHTISEKNSCLNSCPSGIPGIETTLTLMLTAWRDNKISLKKILALMYSNPLRIFKLTKNDDLILVNIVDYKILDETTLATKVKWSPYDGMRLTGFTHYVYSQGKLFDLTKGNLSTSIV